MIEEKEDFDLIRDSTAVLSVNLFLVFLQFLLQFLQNLL